MITIAILFILYSVSVHGGSIIQNSTLNLTQIAYQEAHTKIYLGSPSIVKLPNGIMLASHDTFHNQPVGHVHVYRSDDNGITWHPLTVVEGCYWANLWVLDNDVYMIGTMGDYEERQPIPHLQSKLIFVGIVFPLLVLVVLPLTGYLTRKKSLAINITLVLVVVAFLIAALVWRSSQKPYNPVTIFKSTDNGETWTGGEIIQGTWGTGPLPIVEHNGYYVRSIEHKISPLFGNFSASLMFAPTGHDLLRSAVWQHTTPLAFDPKWIPKSWGHVSNLRFLEGNAVVGPDGTLYDILRVTVKPLTNKACVLQFDPETFSLKFKQFIDFPGGESKFVIRQDPVTKYYISLSNLAPKEFPEARNVLKFAYSKDLFNWTAGPTLLWDDTGLSPEESVELTGFHYVDWQIDDQDIIYVIRTAYQGAHSYHDSNRITYKRLPDFRSLLPV